MEDNTSTVAECGTDSTKQAAQQAFPTTKLICRKEKRPRNPAAYFLTAEEVGYMIGMQEVDARALMKAGAIRAYRVKSRLKTTRQDVDDFLQKLRIEGKGLANVVVVHVPNLTQVPAQSQDSDRQEADKPGTATKRCQKQITGASRERSVQTGPPILKQRIKQKGLRAESTTEQVPAQNFAQ